MGLVVDRVVIYTCRKVAKRMLQLEWIFVEVVQTVHRGPNVGEEGGHNWVAVGRDNAIGLYRQV